MPTVNCPHCQSSLNHVPQLAGQQVTCGNCQGVFEMPQSIPGAQTQPMAQAAPPLPGKRSVGIKSEKSVFRRTVNQRFKPSTSILDLFDWKFEKYVTPLIVRITWILAVAFAAFILTLVLLGPEFWAEILAGAGSRRSASPRSDFRIPLWMLQLILRVPLLVGVIWALLWIRVILESLIVIFHIANSVASIEKNTGNS